MRRAALTMLAALAWCGTASAGTLTGLHDARYCEVIEVAGTPATATVFNTIGFNDCPASRFDKLDAAALAKERGDTAVVLNGPRHFLMDSVTAVAGPQRTFHGLRTRQVATIPLDAGTPLGPVPYVDRTISRTTTWRWKSGRRVYELLAPGGDRYVMQSYSQAVDPITSLHSLPTIGPRLQLPDGWTYRVRRLTKPLALRAAGSATILQDRFLNTYQLASTTRTGPVADHAVAMTGATKTTFGTTPGDVTDTGTVTGSPFGNGTIVLKGTLANGMLTATYRLTFPNGSVLGTVTMPFTITGNDIDFMGTTDLTGGTGAFRGITGTGLQVHDTNTVAGQSGVITLNGTARY